jgi:hypothetical protein
MLVEPSDQTVVQGGVPENMADTKTGSFKQMFVDPGVNTYAVAFIVRSMAAEPVRSFVFAVQVVASARFVTAYMMLVEIIALVGPGVITLV